jgi:dCMP deaminase
MNFWDKTFIEVAKLIAQHSKANRAKVGAILVKNNRIISIGYNGTPSGFDNTCEDENGITKKEVIHAESNCLMKCACSNESTENSTLYVTMSPCFECAKLIIQAKIKNVLYLEEYRDILGIELLKKSNINVRQIL